MVIDYPLYGEPCVLAITLYSQDKNKFTLEVYDAEDVDALFTSRTGELVGEGTYYVMMPICPENAVIEIDSKDNVEVDEIEVLDLKTDYSNSLFQREDVISFIEFAEEFSLNAADLETEKSYYSDDEVYLINYLSQITENGEVQPTPARISQLDGRIEVSKADFMRYTIPMRMAILLHEFSHFYLNKNMEDEVEADRNSLILYMGMGYPKIDAYNVYLDVFANSPTEGNVDRYDELHKLFSNY
jgi:hypothetical protein